MEMERAAGAYLKAAYPVIEAVARRKEEHWSLSASVPVSPEDLETIERGHHDIKKRYIVSRGLKILQRSLPIIDRIDGVILIGKPFRDYCIEIPLILCDKHSHCCLLRII